MIASYFEFSICLEWQLCLMSNYINTFCYHDSFTLSWFASNDFRFLLIIGVIGAYFSLGLTISDWEEVHQSAFRKPSAVEHLVAVCWYGDFRYALKSLSLSCIFGILPLLYIVDQYILPLIVACKIPLKFPNDENSFGNF